MLLELDPSISSVQARAALCPSVENRMHRRSSLTGQTELAVCQSCNSDDGVLMTVPVAETLMIWHWVRDRATLAEEAER